MSVSGIGLSGCEQTKLRLLEVVKAASSSELLQRVIKASIVPRLVTVHAGYDRLSSVATGANGVNEDNVESLFQALLFSPRVEASQLIDIAMKSGFSASEVCVCLLAPAARRLGEAWLNDRCSFLDVTLGSQRLQELLRVLRSRTGRPSGLVGSGRTIVLAATPGEQHLFGLSVLEVVFAEAGWNVVMAAGASAAEIGHLVSMQRCEVVGVTCSCSGLLPALKSAIATVRRAPTVDSVRIIVGGYLYSQVDGFVQMTGADAGAADAFEALSVAEGLVSGDQFGDTRALAHG
jgi:methanogenic corrinoid protein MtbC1